MVGPEIQDSFVVRFWLEDASEGQRIWRGHVQSVRGEEEHYFQKLSDLEAFLERVSGVPMNMKVSSQDE